MRHAFAFMVLGALGALFESTGCSSQAGVGDTCETRGATTTECQDGAVCDSNTAGAVVCLEICVDQKDCASSETCNGVSGSSLKACRAK